MVRSITRWIIGASASPIGIVVLAALDSTLFFSLPFGIDAAVILLAAQHQILTFLIPILATAGGTAGAALTYWMGRKIGEKGLDRHISVARLQRIRNRIETTGAIGLAVLDLMPPPFPFTAFVLAAGALKVSPAVFFVTLGVTRLTRFGAEVWLAVRYGPQVVSWLESDLFADLVGICIVLAVVLTVVSTLRLIRPGRFAVRHRAA